MKSKQPPSGDKADFIGLQLDTSNEYSDMLTARPQDAPDGSHQANQEKEEDNDADESDSEFERMEKEMDEETSPAPPSLPGKRNQHPPHSTAQHSTDDPTEHSDTHSILSNKPSSEPKAPTSSSPSTSPSMSKRSLLKQEEIKASIVKNKKENDSESITSSGSSRRAPTARPRSSQEKAGSSSSPMGRSSSKAKERLDCPTEEPIISGLYR